MTPTQTHAALLISLKDSDFWPADMSLNKWADLVCDELRRLDAENQRLQALLAKLQPAQEPAQEEPTLRDRANSLVEAGHDFWKACKREAGGGAVRWLSCDDGTLIVFTRGEYRDTIMENIGGYKAPEVFFEEDGITAAESKEPAQAGELPDEREAFEKWRKTMQDGYNEWDAWKARAALAARKPLSVDRIHQIGEALADGSYGPVGGPMECYQFEPDSLVEFVRAIESGGIDGLEVKP